MLIILILILVLLWAAVVWSIYSNFLVFYSNFSETENYHKAYYASISALERAELVTKQRQPWYFWSGGIIMWVWTGNSSNNVNWWSDGGLSWFSYYRDNKDVVSVFWNINSRTNRIPASWKWDVERMLSYNESNNLSDNSNYYNMMDYKNAEVFLLKLDGSQGNPYNSWSLDSPSVNKIEWKIRLPQLLTGSFWKLDEKSSLVWLSGSLPPDDSIVDWQIRWNIPDGGVNYPFTIYSTESIDVGGWNPKVNTVTDTVFRESDINGILVFHYGNNGWDPFPGGWTRWDGAVPTIISQKESDIRNNLGNFSRVFNSSIANSLRFSLLNLLQWSGSNVYPFLEYYVSFWWAEVPDKYFNIDAKWEYKDFNVDTVIKKPTVKETIFWSFTSIF